MKVGFYVRCWVLMTTWLICVDFAARAVAESTLSDANSGPVAAAGIAEAASPANQPPQKKSAVDPNKAEDLLNLDIDQLSKVAVHGGSKQTNLTSPSSQVSGKAADSGEATSTADLLKEAPSVSARRVSAITFDPNVRGYNSSQLNATANGMNQLKARLDIDTLFSQIDPGVVQNITVIDGPYTSLYGPGFAFMVADLLPAPRFETPQTHLSTNFVYGSNAQALYTRDNAITGGTDWGACISYGLRDGNDYRTGGPNSYLIPSRYQKWDTFVAASFDVSPLARIEFNCLRTEMNGVELPGVVYDIQNSTNDQFNLSYIIQEDRQGPKQFVLQSWYTQTFYHGDASSPSKQASFYRAYLFEPYLSTDPANTPVNTEGKGDLESLGVRALRTFGQADSPQWTVGADYRRYRQHYLEQSRTANGDLAWGLLYGVPQSQMDDGGVLTDLMLPVSDTLSVNIGGRLDLCKATLDATDPIAAQVGDYTPRYDEPSCTLGMAYITTKQKLTETTTLKGGIAFAMRPPELTELYNFEAFVPMYRFGNSYVDGLSTLRPEKDLQFDLGLTHETKKVSYGVRAFGAIIRDYILPSPSFIDPAPRPQDATHVLGRNFAYFPADQRSDIGTPSENADTCQADYVYVNIAEASLLGGDLFGEYLVREGFSVFGNMSYVYGVNNSPVSVISTPPYFSPDNQLVPINGTDGLPGIYPLYGNVGIRFFEPAENRWCMEFCCRMVRAQDHPAVTLSEVPAPGYTTFAARGYYRLRKNVRVSLDIENLFNRAFTEPGSLAIIGPNGLPTFVEEPGISVLMGVDARF
jgi:iron complex outermembrane recepter protein